MGRGGRDRSPTEPVRKVQCVVYCGSGGNNEARQATPQERSQAGDKAGKGQAQSRKAEVGTGTRRSTFRTWKVGTPSTTFTFAKPKARRSTSQRTKAWERVEQSKGPEGKGPRLLDVLRRMGVVHLGCCQRPAEERQRKGQQRKGQRKREETPAK